MSILMWIGIFVAVFIGGIGVFKEAKKKLKNGDLDYLQEIDPTEYIYQIFYIWKGSVAK